MSNKKVFISSVLAGYCIGIGGTVFLSIENKILGAFFFAIGLLTICSYGLHLYTGKVCYIFDNDFKYKLQIPLIWFGNLLGVGNICLFLKFTRYNTILVEKAQALCDIKLNDNLISLFLLGILCNIMIYIAVEGYTKIQYEWGKYLSLILGVMVFILCGFEHSVADMYYFGMASYWTKESIIRLLIITIGNAIGGYCFHECKKYMQSLK